MATVSDTPAQASTTPASETSGLSTPAASQDRESSDVVTKLLTALANVTILTALLVYFGWRRSATQAEQIGLSESIYGMSTQDYILRSVGPVLTLLATIAVGGLCWLWLDFRIMPRILNARGQRDPVIRYGLRALSLSWLALPLLSVGLGYIWPAGAFVMFPLSIGCGLLLTLYGMHLRQLLPNARHVPPGREVWIRAFAAAVVCISLFWATSNYAEIVGKSLADQFVDEVLTLPGVVLYSSKKLHITAPGIAEHSLGGGNTEYGYRYTGLRLLTHTGHQYFLISDGWTPEYGVVVRIADSDPLRLEFLHDER